MDFYFCVAFSVPFFHIFLVSFFSILPHTMFSFWIISTSMRCVLGCLQIPRAICVLRKIQSSQFIGISFMNIDCMRMLTTVHFENIQRPRKKTSSMEKLTCYSARFSQYLANLMCDTHTHI